MSLLLEPINVINRFMNKYEDSRTADWFLMSSPFYTLGICLSYVYLVKVLGPKWMENRKPFQLKRTLVVYNFLQVIFSIWLFYMIGMGGWFTGEYSIRCQPVDYSNKTSAVQMVHASWWYYFSKFTEFFDTIFFVLRKKNDQISLLHVVHHGVMPMSVWFGVKFYPGGHSTFFGLLNTFVHIIMYAYYMLSACGPHMQRYLWWKKYLTTLQMIQFVAIMTHAFQLLFTDCNYPRAFVWWIGMHAVMFFFLFKEFYVHTYNRKAAAALTNNNNNVKSKKLEANGDGVHLNGTSLANGTNKHLIRNGTSNGVTKQNGINGSAYYANGDLHQRIAHTAHA